MRLRPPRPSRTYVVALVLTFATALTWAAATPMFGVPDELSHMIRAAAAARGDVDGAVAPDGVSRLYRAPAILVVGSTIETDAVPCYAFKRDQSPHCLVFGPPRGEERIASSADSYAPVYYLLVGWPSVAFGGLRGMYAMRALACALFALFIALGVSSLDRSDLRAVNLALLVALTPMVWFLGAAVNPSSLAISAAIAAWTGGFRLICGREDPSAIAWRFGLPLCALLVVRRDSLLWAGIIVVSTAALAKVPRLRSLLRSRATVAWAMAAAASAAYSTTSGASAGVEILRSEEVTGSAAAAFGSLPEYLFEMVGVLGWLDTPIPEGAYLLWLLVFFGIVTAALAHGRRREVFACIGLAVAVVASIVAIGANRFPYFQGRYGLPGAVGVPLLAGLAVAAVRPAALAGRRPAILVVSAMAVVNTLAFYEHLRRYSVVAPSWSIFDGPAWESPAAPHAVLVALHLACTTAVALGIARAATRQASTGDGDEPIVPAVTDNPHVTTRSQVVPR